MTEVVFAKTTATVAGAAGIPVVIREGDHWDASDPVVRRNPDMFTDDPEVGMHRSVGPVEQATAAPGERRINVRR